MFKLNYAIVFAVVSLATCSAKVATAANKAVTTLPTANLSGKPTSSVIPASLDKAAVTEMLKLAGLFTLW